MMMIMTMMAWLSRSPTAYHSLQRVIIIAVPPVLKFKSFVSHLLFILPLDAALV